MKGTKVSTDEKKIDELLSRSIAAVLPTKEEFKKVLLSGNRLRIYIGADATGPQLHLGHATNFMLLERLRQLGHEVIVLFGDFTAMIGDPTDKDAARKQLTKKEVDAHIATWKSQVEKILPFTGKDNPAQILRNSKWLSKLTFSDVIDIASEFTVQHMLERDMFERRLNEHKPIYVHEFFYPFMQGYDSVAMDVDVEVGGTDQTFNMLAGRTLQKRYNNREKFVIATTLLENPKTGKKLMSKSEGGYIALNDTPTDMYGKVMALPDEVTKQMFVDCTYVPLPEISNILESHPKEAKMRLAREIVTLYHGAKLASLAEEGFVATFQNKEVPEDVVAIKGVDDIGGELVRLKIVVSKSELARLLKAGGVRNVETGEKIESFSIKIPKTITIRIGKRRFVKIEPK